MANSTTIDTEETTRLNQEQIHTQDGPEDNVASISTVIIDFQCFEAAGQETGKTSHSFQQHGPPAGSGKQANPQLWPSKKGKGFPYSLQSIRPEADPSVRLYSLQVTVSHPPDSTHMDGCYF